MYKLIVFVFAITVINGCGSSKVTSSMNTADNTLTPQEQKEGWKLLFDGTTTTGWHSYGYNTVGKTWGIDNNTIHLDLSTRSEWPANESHDLVTDDEYDNFDFKIDWKIAPKGNSGVIFYL